MNRVLVRSGPALVLSPPKGGRFSGFNRGLFRSRSPFPVGVIHICSPLFMSMAVIREYGGLKSCKPCGIRGGPFFDSIYRRFPLCEGSGSSNPFRDHALREGTYRIPVAGSAAAPPQFPPPSELGRWIVPSSDGGANSGPSRNPFTVSPANARICGVKS